jgi:hypothetical protein
MKLCPHLPHSVSEVDWIRYGRCPRRYWLILSVVKIVSVKGHTSLHVSLYFFSPSQKWNKQKYVTFMEKPIIVWFIFYAFRPICASLLRSFYLDIVPATQHCITCPGLKLTTFTDYIHHSKLYIILTSDIGGLHCILFHFISFYDILRNIPTNNYIDFNIVK